MTTNYKKFTDGVESDMSAEEIALYDADVVKATTERTARDEAEAQKATDKANAKAKLIAGEPLTEDEANTIVL